jgi:hypothetical protein
METIFEDNFVDNRNDWPESEDYVLKVGKGKYRFEHKRDSGSWFSWKSIKINQNYNFEIECTIKKISGDNDGVYELLWGFFEQFLGQKIGFRLENKIAVDIKHISIRQDQ